MSVESIRGNWPQLAPIVATLLLPAVAAWGLSLGSRKNAGSAPRQ